jgi:hypothetical protein
MFRWTRESSAGFVYVASAPFEHAAPVPPIAGERGPHPMMSSGEAWAEAAHPAASSATVTAAQIPGARIVRTAAEDRSPRRTNASQFEGRIDVSAAEANKEDGAA